MSSITVGTASARPGQIVRGWLDGVDLPTGGRDRFPVIIIQGNDVGPVMWVTASIHGGEHTGLIAALQLSTEELAHTLRGTLVIIPTLNPAGLRIKERSPYYFKGDPNRLFPEPRNGSQNDEGNQPTGLERAYRTVYDAVAETGADYLLDLHNAQIGSLPVVFRDPVFYQRGRGKGLSKRAAIALQDQTGKMLDALGFTIVNEFAADSYVNRNLHRSVSGAVLNGLAIPAATVELGSWLHIDPFVVDACLVGIHNTLRWAGMLEGHPQPIAGVSVFNPEYAVRRHYGPYAPHAGIVHHLVRPGETFEPGQPLVRMTDISGQPLGDNDGLLHAEHEGFVIGWQHGVVRYEGEPIMVLAIKDDSDLIVPYPY